MSDKDVEPVPSKRGKFNLGDPNDKSLRKIEKDVIIWNRLKEAAIKKCDDVFSKFLDCAQKSGLGVVIYCKKENKLQLECISKWMQNEALIEEVTNKYLEERTYYRATGKPVYSRLPKRH